MTTMNLEQIAKLPVKIEHKDDDGAYDEAHVETTYETKSAADVFGNNQIRSIKNMLVSDEKITQFSIDDYTYFSTGGSVFARVTVEMQLSSGDNICLHKYEDSGKSVSINYKKFEFMRNYKINKKEY